MISLSRSGALGWLGRMAQHAACLAVARAYFAVVSGMALMPSITSQQYSSCFCTHLVDQLSK